MADNVIPFKQPPKTKIPQNFRKPPKPPKRWPPTTIAFLACVLGVLSIGAFSPWTVGMTVRHLIAATGCPAARLVKLAPAHINEPGYWPHLDPERTGISCATISFPRHEG